MFVFCLIPLFSCRSKGDADTSLARDVFPAEERKAEGFVSAMRLEEKCSQLFMVALNGTTSLSDATAQVLKDCAPGAVLFFKYNISDDLSETFRLTEALQDIARESGAGIPFFIAVDHEGGLVFRFKSGVTRLPAASQVAKSANVEKAKALYAVAAKELRSLGFNMNLAPVLEPLSNDNQGFLGSRSFGRDADVVAAFGTACIEAMQENGVCAVAKHFPANGNTDPHESVPSLPYTRSDLTAKHIGPFKAAVEHRVAAVMVSHVAFPEIDADYPATLSKAIVGGLLKDRLGYKGIVLTDDLRMKALTETYEPAESAVLALKAGADMVMYTGGDFQAVRDAVVEAVREGSLPESRVDDAVRRIIETKIRFKLWEDTAPERREELFGTLAGLVQEGEKILSTF